MNRLPQLALLVVLLCTLRLSAETFILLDTMPGTNETYTDVDDTNGAAGTRFSLQQDDAYRIEQVILPLTQLGALQGLSLTLQTDANREPSGQVLDTFVIIDGELQDTPEDIYFRGLAQPVLEPYRSYWLVLESQSTLRWHWQSKSNQGAARHLGFYREDGGLWYSQQYSGGLNVKASFAESTTQYSHTPRYYHAWVEGGPTERMPWPDEDSTEAELVLFDGELPPGQHTINIQIEYDDGGLSPVVCKEVYIEPGPENFLLSYRITEEDGTEYDGNVLSDNTSVDETFGLTLLSFDPGPHRLILESAVRDAEGTFPTLHHFFIEPDEQAHFNLAELPNSQKYLQLIDKHGEKHGLLPLVPAPEQEYGLHSNEYVVDEEYDFHELLAELPLDATYRLIGLFTVNGGSHTTNTTAADSPALYRQQNYSDWIYERTQNYHYELDDLDDDGLTNLQEWYFKTDPLVPDYAHSPQLKAVPDGLEISWVGRGGGTLNRDGHLYFESMSNHFGLMYNEDWPNASWQQGFPRFYLYDEPDGYRLVREPLPSGMERIRFTLLNEDSSFLNEPLFFRWGP